jgi:hypothetical protein
MLLLQVLLSVCHTCDTSCCFVALARSAWCSAVCMGTNRSLFVILQRSPSLPSTSCCPLAFVCVSRPPMPSCPLRLCIPHHVVEPSSHPCLCVAHCPPRCPVFLSLHLLLWCVCAGCMRPRPHRVLLLHHRSVVHGDQGRVGPGVSGVHRVHRVHDWHMQAPERGLQTVCGG